MRAKEQLLTQNLPKDRPWTDYTQIRVGKKQSAVVMVGDKAVTAWGKPGDYRLQTEEDVSGAKVYFVRTDTISGKVYESNGTIVYPAREPSLGVEQQIRLRCALYFQYRVKNPKAFMNYCGQGQPRQVIESELYSVCTVCLPDVLAQLSAEGVAYNQLSAQSKRLTELMAEKLTAAWLNARGIALKGFTFVKAAPYKVDEKAFLEKCAQAESSSDFSAEFSKLLQELGQVAGDAINAFQGEVASLFGDLAESLDRELQADEEDDAEYDSLLDSILNGAGMDVMGTWECPELKQTVTFALLDAAIETDGKEIWRGDWEQTRNEEGTTLIVCPTARSLGCYEYFEHHTNHDNPDEEYLAGVLTDTGTEKQYIRFVKLAK